MGGTVILIGYRGVGKTTIGRKVARSLGWDFLDTDKEIGRRKGAEVQEIVASQGWQEFRSCEKKVIQSLDSLHDTVVATGGGAVLHEEEWRRLIKRNIIIWLMADTQVIIDRINNDKVSEWQRPSLTGGSIEEETAAVLEQRQPLYQKIAHYKIDTGVASIEESVQKIEEIVRRSKK